MTSFCFNILIYFIWNILINFLFLKIIIFNGFAEIFIWCNLSATIWQTKKKRLSLELKIKAINLEFLKLDHIYLPFSGKLFYFYCYYQPLIHTFIDLLLVLLILVIISKDLILILWNFRKHFIFLLLAIITFQNFQGYLNLILFLACLRLFWLFSLFLIFKTEYLNLSKKFTIYKKKFERFKFQYKQIS